MEYVIIGACIVVAIAGGIVLYVKNKRTKNELGNTAVVVSKTSSSKLQASEVANDLVIQIGILPADAISDETKLVEITDSKVLAHINNLVPGLAQAGNAANNATQAVKANGEVLYRAIIPAGAKLTDSKAMEGAVRGIYHGADGIRGHANLVAVEAQKGTAVVANTAAAAMSVASMIVGQYYMTQINAELGAISDGISQIQNFQDNEYRSRIFSLVAHVKKIADFQTEILENDELRLSKIAQLDSLEEECTKLLGQANLTLAGFAKKSGLNYDGYEKALENAQNWFMYQQSLEYAKEHFHAKNITYRQMALEDICQIDEQFDLITSSLAFDYAEDLDKLMKNIYGLLKYGAHFVFSMSHPMATAWDGQYDRYTRTESGERLYANISNYMVEGKRTVKWVVEDYEVYHRTFSSIVNTIVNAGFLIEECEESHVSDEMRKQYPAQFGGTLHRPDFIFFRCKKQS